MVVENLEDLAQVAPQCTTFASYPDAPSPTSQLFRSHDIRDNAGGGQDHHIVGVDLVLKPGDANGLWEMLVDPSKTLSSENQKKQPDRFLSALHSVTLCCDRLEIHGRLRLPQAEVRIYARELVWATPDAAIDTTPLPWDFAHARNAEADAPGGDGADGRAGGSVAILVDRIVAAATAAGPRVTTNGGIGQDPGTGIDGMPGKSLQAHGSYTFSSSDSSTGVVNTLKVAFDPPAVYARGRWYPSPAMLVPLQVQLVGENAVPTSGKNATAAGSPGHGGNAGHFVTNNDAFGPDATDSWVGAHGHAGAPARLYKGGAAGRPRKCAKYEVKIHFWVFKTTSKPWHKISSSGVPATNDGKDAPPKRSEGRPGSDGSAHHASCSNAWLHPLAVQLVLHYARRLFIAGKHADVETLLQVYEKAFASGMPQSADPMPGPVWTGTTGSLWSSARTEVVAMLQHLRGRLDYFGNPAGYTPLLSLGGTIQLYQQETQRALRTMLLAARVKKETSDAEHTVSVLGSLIDELIGDSLEAVEQVTAAQAALETLDSRLASLERQLETKQDELRKLRDAIEARADMQATQKAALRASIKLAGAICQVIPVGQPALGAVGSLAGVGADLIGGEQDPPDTLSRMGGVISSARAAGKANAKAEAGRAAEQAKAAKEADDAWRNAFRSDKSTEQEVANWRAASDREAMLLDQKTGALGTALDGLGPAVTQLSEAVRALQVSDAELAAAVLRLEAESPELGDLLGEIRTLNDTKADVFPKLIASLRSLMEGYSRVAYNAAATVHLQQERNAEQVRLDPEASQFVQGMEQRSRARLQYYLYLMVKAYETTALRALKVDWDLSDVTAGIKDLLDRSPQFEQASLETQAQTLAPLFQDNIDSVRDALLNDAREMLGELRTRRPLVFSAVQSPAELQTLNADEDGLVIDPFARGLVDPAYHLMRLVDVTLDKVQFDPPQATVPSGHLLVVEVQPAAEGTMRRGSMLCRLRASADLRWSWTVADSISADEPSMGSRALLDFVLGKSGQQQLLARPPLWSDLRVKLRYSPPLRPQDRPRVSRLEFMLVLTHVAAPEVQRVLAVHPAGLDSGVVVSCTPDLAARGPGTGHFMRVFEQHDSAVLGVKADSPMAEFCGWESLGGAGSTSQAPQFRLALDAQQTVYHYWAARDAAGADATPARSGRGMPPAALMAGRAPSTGSGLPPRPDTATTARAPAGQAHRPQIMRMQAAADAAVVTLVPDGAVVEVLRQQDGWQEANYKGWVGWLELADGTRAEGNSRGR